MEKMLTNRDVNNLCKQIERIKLLVRTEHFEIFYFISLNMGPTLIMLHLYFCSVNMTHCVSFLTSFLTSHGSAPLSLPFPRLLHTYCRFEISFPVSTESELVSVYTDANRHRQTHIPQSIQSHSKSYFL